MEIYLVGGAVRDKLLGKPVHDRDWVVVGATPGDMLARGFRQVGADFPVFLHPDTREEYALARTERKQGHGYHGFSVYSAADVTLEEDLQRRDLTINAMAEDEDGHLVDPFNGRRDLEQRILRHVSPAFQEDPLRILRLARFAARLAPLGFEVARETRQLMEHMVRSGEADHLVAERIWQETHRALHENRPRVYFEVLRQCGALAVVMPELDVLFAPADGQGPTAGERALQALGHASQVSDSTAVRFAALTLQLPRKALQALCDRLKVPNDCRELALLAARLQPAIAQLDNPIAEEALVILNHADAWRRPERFEDLLRVCESYARAAGNTPEAFSPGTLLRQALLQAQEVQARTYLDQGITGKALGEAIHQGRRDRIQAVLDDLSFSKSV